MTGFSAQTDQQFTDSLTSIPNALNKVLQIETKQFVFKTDSFPSSNFPVGKQLSIIAQQTDTVVPELVVSVVHPQKFDSLGTVVYDSIHYKSVDYNDLIPLTIAAIQEQQLLIDSLAAGKVSANTNPTDSNRLTKWSAVNNVLANSLVYDDGTRIGVPAVQPGAYVNIQNHSADSVVLLVTADSINTSHVINAHYSTNGNTGIVTFQQSELLWNF